LPWVPFASISPADLQLADPPVVIKVTVRVNPDAPSGIYTNMAFVSHPRM